MTRTLLPTSLTLLAALSAAVTLASCGVKHELAYEEDGAVDGLGELDATTDATTDANATALTHDEPGVVAVGPSVELQTTALVGEPPAALDKKSDERVEPLAERRRGDVEESAASASDLAGAGRTQFDAGISVAEVSELEVYTVASSKAEKMRERRAAQVGVPRDPTAGARGSVATAPTSTTNRTSPPPAAMPAQPQPPRSWDPGTVTSSETYTDYGVNDFTLVEKDALSTFSIDVDTASYTVSRRKLNEGALPPQASVRVEEFVNYFDYDYVTPKNDPFAVNMEAMPDPFRPGHTILRVGVQGKEVSQADRPALHLTFLADVSGSMSSRDKLPLAKQSLHMLVDSMQEGDTVALATYAGRVAKILGPTDVTRKSDIHAAIESLSSGGSTAMSSGIDLAYEMAWQSFEPGAENRVVVLSDGDANVGRTSWDDMLGQVKGYADRGVTLTTVGFGMGNYKDTLMEQLANKGDGNNFYIDSRAQAQRVFVEEMGSAMITIARDVKIQVEFNDESVMAYRLVGYENRDIADVDFRNDRVDAGEVGSGHSVTALYDVILRDGYDRGLATVRMRYEAPGADKAATEKVWTFQANRLRETSSLASRDTRIAYTAATFAEVLRGSPHAAEIDLGALAAFGQKSARSGEKDDRELIELIKTADRLGADDFDAAVTAR